MESGSQGVRELEELSVRESESKSRTQRVKELQSQRNLGRVSKMLKMVSREAQNR